MRLFKLRKKIIFTTFLLIVIFTNNTFAIATSELCQFQNGIFRTANRMFQNKQYLLSSTQYLTLFNSKCSELRLSEKSRYNYSLVMLELGENSEIIEQYRYFKKNNLTLKNQIKQIIQVATSDTSNVDVRIWNSLDGEETKNVMAERGGRLNSVYQSYAHKKSKRKPIVAGILSAIIPGGGQVYNGAYQSAAISFLLNSIFFLSSTALARQGLTAPAVASGLVFSVTYLGNILNAVRGASNLNSFEARNEKAQMKRLLFPILELKF